VQCACDGHVMLARDSLCRHEPVHVGHGGPPKQGEVSSAGDQEMSL
jgi:hypothetical protein